MILLPRLDLKQLLQTIADKKPTAFAAVPTLLTAINTYPDLAKYDLSSLKVCVSGGAPLPADVRDTFERLTGCRVIEGYGLSECAPVVCRSEERRVGQECVSTCISGLLPFH